MFFKKNKIVLFLILLLITSCAKEEIKVEYVKIPDTILEKYLITYGFDSEQIEDNRILLSDAEKVDTLSLWGRNLIWSNVVDLEGIQYFKNLKRLFLETGSLEFIDISSNSKLNSVTYSGNNLKVIKLPINSSLKELYITKPYYLSEPIEIDLSTSLNLEIVYLEKIKNINLKNNSKIKELWIRSFDSTLDISHLADLERLYLIGSSYTKLDLSKNLKLKYLYTDTPNITCIKISEGQNFQVSSDINVTTNCY